MKQPFPLRAKTEKKKGYIPKVWEKETSNGASQEKKKKKKRQKYRTNEETRQKLTRPNKQGGNKQTA